MTQEVGLRPLSTAGGLRAKKVESEMGKMTFEPEEGREEAKERTL